MPGLDFGTTRTKAAFVDPSGKPVAVPNARGELCTPTVVYYPKDAPVLVGQDAYEQGYMDPPNTARNFKLRLGSNENILSDGRSVTATDATAAVLAQVKEDVERATNLEISDCVPTIPANWRDDAKQALIEACHRVGLTPLLLLPEPTAAGFAYALPLSGRKALILVYDFGGGTFDTSVLSVEGHEIRVLATEGVAKLGGNDINECLRALVLGRMSGEYADKPDPKKDPLFFLDLDQRVEQAKMSLATRSEVPVVVSFQGKQSVIKIAREAFHREIDPLVQQSLASIDRVLSAAGVKVGHVDRLLMVGGSSRLPCIQDAVAKHTGLVPRTDIDPDKAVAYGAALAYVAERAKRGQPWHFHGKTIPCPDILVRDVTAHAVGCCVIEYAGASKRLKNAVIIPKNAPIPCHRVDTFCLEYDDQTAAQIEILQGDPDADRDKCLLIGELRLENLPKESRRTPRILVEYVIDANGMVTATATDKISGQRQTVSVDYKKGIQPKGKPTAA